MNESSSLTRTQQLLLRFTSAQLQTQKTIIQKNKNIMAAVSGILSNHLFSVPKPQQRQQGYLDSNKPISRRGKSKKGRVVVSCSSSKKAWERAKTEKNYYELLGVSAESNSQEIKVAYRRLQKKHHPDIAGQKGHEYTLLLNEAYQVLMREELRKEYDASIGQFRVGLGGKASSDLGYHSIWKGPLRPQALFVDENACIGCRECVHHANNTFVMDEALGCARVKVQYGDDDKNIEVSVDSCPVNCIHWVEREDLAVLEFLIKPQPKEGYGVFGGGWEKPANVFMAAKSFSKQLKQKAENHHHTNVRTTVEEETPAQAEARASASIKLQMERFSRIWNWVKDISGSKRWNGE